LLCLDHSLQLPATGPESSSLCCSIEVMSELFIAQCEMHTKDYKYWSFKYLEQRLIPVSKVLMGVPDLWILGAKPYPIAMPKGERGSSRPYLRGRIWWIRYRVPSEDHERFESSKSSDKKVALRLLNQRRKEIDDRLYSVSDASVDDLLDLYLRDQRKQQRKSYESAQTYVRNHISPAFGRVKASAVTSHMIERFIEEKQSQGFANASINRWLSAFNRAFTLGKESVPPLVIVSPRIVKLEEDNVREGFLEHFQYESLLGELPDHQRLVLVIGYHLGNRRGEILKLRWDQIDWRCNLLRLEKRQTKAKEARVAPLYGDLRPFLETAHGARDPACPFIISWHGLGIGDLKRAWKNACKRAGVPDLHIHDLRRTAARNMIRAGVPEKQVMRIVGWKTHEMLDRYNILDERDAHLAGQRMQRYFDEERNAAEVRTKVRTVEAIKGNQESPESKYLQ